MTGVTGNSSTNVAIPALGAVQQTDMQEQVNEGSVAASAAPGDPVEISDLARELASASELDKVDTTQSAEQASLATREAKDAEGARFDKVLAELRSQYGEQEAMARFNDFMRSEGYEVYEPNSDELLYAPRSKIIGAALNSYGNRLTHSQKAPYMQITNVTSSNDAYVGQNNSGVTFGQFQSNDLAGSSFNTLSVTDGRMVNGEMQYKSATWASYHAGVNSDFEEVMSFWKNRNVDKLSEKAGFDVGGYVDDLKLYWGKSFSAESVSADLGGIVADWLAKAGITLDPGTGQNVSFYLNVIDNKARGLNVNINFGDQELRTRLKSVVNDALGKDPGILAAFERENNSVEQYDIDTLDAAFSNGKQSNRFLQHRMFVMSGDQPSALVMGSGLDHRQTGYEYVKKISNTFDVKARAYA